MVHSQFMNSGIARQIGFVNATVGTQEITQASPTAFVRVDMDFADTVSIVIACPFIQRLITNRGYSVRVTQASSDLGVDLIASRNNEKNAIQAKRYESKVSRRAISDAVAGMHYYGCNKAMVISNIYFSPGAITLAQSTGCILIDRDTLAKWVNEFQNTKL